MSENNNQKYDRLDSNGLLYLFQRLKTVFAGLFVGKETGKGLSSNDYTTAEKTKLSGIAEGATANVGTVTGIAMNGSQKTVDANGNVDLGTVLTVHQDISGKADIEDVPTKTSDLTNDSGFLTQHQDISGKADLDSPNFTGTPTVPTAATASDNTTVANTAFVKAAISAALSGKIDLHFEFLQTLPATGVVGTFYFIPNPDSVTGDEWLEYVWDAANSKFERVGSAAVDLTGYFNTTNLPAITNTQIDAILAT